VGVATPERYLHARIDSVDAVLRRLLGDAVDRQRWRRPPSWHARQRWPRGSPGGPSRANVALEWPAQPHLVALACADDPSRIAATRMSPHCLVAPLDPCEALVAFSAEGKVEAERLRKSRSWTDDEWSTAAARLRDRANPGRGQRPHRRGIALRRWSRTAPTRHQPAMGRLGANKTERLAELARPFASRSARVTASPSAIDGPASPA